MTRAPVIILISLLLIGVAILLREKVVKGLWWIYGFTYDGLLHFYPYRHLVSQIIERIPHQPGNVLEIGCGTGNVLAGILAQYPASHVNGVDISTSMLAVAGKKLSRINSQGSYHLVHQDILAFLQTQPDNTYDTIVSVNVLYALHNRVAVWRELFRVLKPKGTMVMSTSTKTGSWPIIQDHVKHQGWLSLMRPSLLGVFLIDSLISLIGATGHFAFPSSHTLNREVTDAGGRWLNEGVTYGGDNGVNTIFEVQKTGASN